MSTGTRAPDGAPNTSAQNAAETAQQKAGQAADQAQQKAAEAAGQAKRTVRDQLEQRSSQAAEQIGQQASDLRAVSESLRGQGKEGPAKAADQLAGYAEQVGSYLRDKDGDALLHDVEDLARRQPLAVGAGALALGFAASRFLKASSRERYSSRSGGSSSGRPAGGPPVPSTLEGSSASAPTPPPMPPVPATPVPAGAPVPGL